MNSIENTNPSLRSTSSTPNPSSSQAVPIPTPSATTVPMGTSTSTSNEAEWQKVVKELNQRLNGSQTTAVLDSSAPANQVWVNIVDKDSGQVIERFPPDALRKFSETGQLSGFSVDQQL